MNIRAKIFGGSEADQQSLLVSKQPKGAKSDMLNSISVDRAEHRHGNTRSDDRHRLPDVLVSARHKGKTHDVQLINLSGGGAMIYGGFQPMLWDRVDLKIGDDGTIECAVRWLKDDKIGLEFAHETRLDCSADEQAELLRAVITNNFGDVDYQPATVSAEPEHDGEEQRLQRRHPLIWSGVLHYDFNSFDVRLRNISSTGALVDCNTLLPIGAEPLLDLGAGGTIFATVNWAAGDQMGLRFHEPYDLAQLAKAKPQLAPSDWERPSYLEPTLSADSPWADEWKRMSLGELREQLDGFIKR